MAASISSDDLKTRSYTNLYSHTTFSDNSEDNNNNNDDDDTSKDSTASSDTSKDICSGSDASSDTCNKDDSVSGGHVLSDTLLRPKRHVRSNLRRAPSQLNMHHTTVPQALVPSQLGSRQEIFIRIGFYHPSTELLMIYLLLTEESISILCLITLTWSSDISASRHAPTRSSLRHSRIMSSKQVKYIFEGNSLFIIFDYSQASMISSSYKRLDTRWVWLGLAQLLLATISILATITIMATIHFSSTYNWTFYSGPWVGKKLLAVVHDHHNLFYSIQVLLSSFLILFYYWFNYKNTLSSSPAYIVQPQELECRKLEVEWREILFSCLKQFPISAELYSRELLHIPLLHELSHHAPRPDHQVCHQLQLRQHHRLQQPQQHCDPHHDLPHRL